MKPEESYKILVEWHKHTSDRLQHFNTINMAVQGLFLTAIGFMIYDKDLPLVFEKYDSKVCTLSLVGLIFALTWLKGLIRIKDEVDFRSTLLRRLERKMGCMPAQQLFTEGYRFFFPNEARERVSTRALRRLNMNRRGLGLLNVFRWQLYFLILIYVLLVVGPLVNGLIGYFWG